MKRMDVGFYLAGEWVKSGVLRPSGDPFRDDKPIKLVHLAQPQHVAEAYRRAEAAAAAWRDIACEERANFLEGAFDLVYEQRYEIAKLISREQGKTLTEALTLEVIPSLDMLRFYASKAPLFLSPDKVSFHQPFFHTKESRVVFAPLGVVAVLTSSYAPWVAPFMATVLALITGNAVLLKPSVKTALCGLKVAEIFHELRLPPGLLSVLTGGDQTGALVAGQPVQAITLVGARETCERVARDSSCTFKKLIIECGGKNPFIVLEDANLDVAATAALWGAFSNNGQSHGATGRLLLQESIAGEFKEILLERFHNLKLGDPLDPDTDLGPMIDTERHEFLERLISDAVSAGARILARKEIPEGLGKNFFAPVILENVDNTMHLSREPYYGPILTIQTFRNDAELLELANDTIYGLSASLWSSDVQRLGELLGRMQFGNIWVNDVMFPYEAPQAPWGGTKESGHGQLHSPYGLLEYVYLKHVGFDSAQHPSKDYYFPYNRDLRGYIEEIAESLKITNPFARFLNKLWFWDLSRMRQIRDDQ